MNQSLTKLVKRAVPDAIKQAFFRARWRWSGRNIRVASTARIDHGTRLGDHTTLHAGSTVFGSSVGRWSYLGDFALVIHADIGAFCSIAHHVIIGGGTHPTNDFVSTCPLFYSARAENPWREASLPGPAFNETPRTYVGNDVWIGYGAIVLPGVRIGDGAIVAAGAVVTKDVQPYEIVGGVPAKRIRFRFEASDIEWLLKLEWWRWPDERLKQSRAQFAHISHLRREHGPGSAISEAEPSPVSHVP